MKRGILLIVWALSFTWIGSPLMAEEDIYLDDNLLDELVIQMEDDGFPVPYTEEEFSTGLHKLRRAETIFFGSIPIVAVGVTIAAEVYRQGMASFKAPPLTNDQIFQRAYITVGLSAGVALIDWIIGEVRENSEQEDDSPAK